MACCEMSFILIVLSQSFMCMKTVCDNKGTGVSKASLFDVLSREDHASVGAGGLPRETAAINCVELTV